MYKDVIPKKKVKIDKNTLALEQISLTFHVTQTAEKTAQAVTLKV